MKIGAKAEIFLGKKIAEFRISKNIQRIEIAKKIRQTERQIEKYENGEFIPIPVLESIMEAMGEPIQKRLIRQISNLRKLEKETKIEQDELISLYQQIFEE